MALSLDEAIKHCYEVADAKCDDCGEEHLQLAKWLEELKQYKIADVVEVVRCKRCKYWTGEEYYGCCKKNNMATRHADDFCNDGEKK